MEVIQIKENEFEEKVVNSKGKVLVDCFATWCGPCKMLSPIIDELAGEEENCTFYKLDVDESEEIARQYGIMSIPTLLLFEDGNLKKQSSGFQPKDALKDFINK